MNKFVFTLVATLMLTVPALADGGIQWYGTWQSGLAAAQASNRPILLVSGAAACHGVPGIW